MRLVNNGVLYSILILLLFQSGCERTVITNGLTPFEIYCDSLEKKGIIDDYKFPVLPGTEEWNELTYEQQDSILQIPVNTLANMCTYGLLETCLNYPLLKNCIESEYIRYWWIVFGQSFNGINEFLARDDASEKLLNKYLEFQNFPYSDTLTDPEKYVISTQLVFLEIALSQETFLSEYSNSEQKELINKVLANLEHKLNCLDFPNDFSFPVYSGWLLGRIMLYNDYQPFIDQVQLNETLDSFINGPGWIIYYFVSGANVHEIIVESSLSFLNEL